MRHELLDGVHVVTPSPRLPHQRFLSNLEYALRRALENRRDLEVFHSPADVVLEPRTLVQPDLFVIRQNPQNRVESWDQIGIPVLAVEVLSASTAARDRGAKRKIYQRVGIAEYWIVDLDARLLERWKPEDDRPEIIDNEFVWMPADDVSVTVPLDELFGTV